MARRARGITGVLALAEATLLLACHCRPQPVPPGMARLAGGGFNGRTGSATVVGFTLDVTEVTADAYAMCVRAGPCTTDGITASGCNYGVAGKGDHPINCVDWFQATAYCEAQGKRLPTEEEWQWAARGGAKGSIYPWGNAKPDRQLCWSGASRRSGTCPVGSFPAGDAPGGIHDLAGNVWEWTASHYAPFGKNGWGNHAGCSGYTDGSGDPIIRGGAWNHDEAQLVTADEQGYFRPETRMDNLGFRCAR